MSDMAGREDGVAPGRARRLHLAGDEAPAPARPPARRRLSAPVIGAALTALWLAAVAAFFLAVPGATRAGAPGLGAAVAVALPLSVIWAAVAAAWAAETLRRERRLLEAAAARLRATGAPPPQAGADPEEIAQLAAAVAAPLEERLEELARAQRQVEAALSRVTGQGGPVQPARRQRPAPAPRTVAVPTADPPQTGEAPETAPDAAAPAPPAPGETAQPALALDTPADARHAPIAAARFVQALNFPLSEQDVEGFVAMRQALRDPFSAGLVRSAQDVLTLLSEDGIYMDDLAPDRARPELWRRFARGERGQAVAAVGGIRDRDARARVSTRMKQDPVFRDVAHHFLRKFDQVLAAFEPRADDATMAALADTRTARAFMLLGRVAGTFD
jgi:hypothetical protein